MFYLWKLSIDQVNYKPKSLSFSVSLLLSAYICMAAVSSPYGKCEIFSKLLYSDKSCNVSSLLNLIIISPKAVISVISDLKGSSSSSSEL